MYDLVNIFDIFLPQLLLYPNPSDPLNPEAARLLNDNPNDYKKKVIDYVKLNAGVKIILNKKEIIINKQTVLNKEHNDNSELSNVSINDDELNQLDEW